MTRTRLSFFLTLVVLETCWATSASVAGIFTWDGGDGSTTDIMAANNWDTNVAPSISTNPATDELHFGPAAFTTVGHNAQVYVDKFIFDAGAPAYTITEHPTSPGTDFAFFGGPNSLLLNNSSVVQSFGSAINASGITVKTPSAGLEFHGNYFYSTSEGIRFWLTNDVTINTRQLQAGTRHVYGANGIATTTADTAGTLILNGTGTGTGGGTNLTGQVSIWSGAVRVGNSGALGVSTSSSNNTYVHGTFVNATDNPDAQAVGGFEHGFGRLELYNNITLAERVRLDGRQGDAADFDHVVNFSGTNTINNINQIAGAGHWNFDSLSGTLTVTNNMHCSDPGQFGGATHSNSVWTFRGAGNINYTGNLLLDDFPETVTALRKQGDGTLALSGAGNTWEGGTLVEGGIVSVAATKTFSTAGARIHVAGGATLDLSAISGLTLGANKTLSGSGLVKGNVTTNNALATINAGGTGSLDGTDAIAVTTGAGLLTLDNNLDMSAGGSLAWNLALLSESGAGTGFDQVAVNGDLALGGSSSLLLDFSMLGGAGPDSSDAFWTSNHSWKIIDTFANTLGATFGSITTSTFAHGTFTTSVSSGDIMLNYAAVSGLQGDYNGDTKVDAADYVVWRKHPEDFPEDAYATWRSHFGNGSGSGSGSELNGASTNVPEPGAIVLALVAVVGLLTTAPMRTLR